MPIDFLVDHTCQMIMARVRGVVTLADIDAMARRLGARTDIAGFNGLVDLTDIEHFIQPSADQVRQLASLFTRGDGARTEASTLAIVAPDDLLFGMAEMFESYCHADGRGANRVRVFRTMAEAAAFLHLPEDVFSDC